MFKEYTFDYKEKDMFVRADNIADIISQNSVNTQGLRGMGGLNRLLDVMADAKVWITDEEGEPYAMSSMGSSGNTNGMGMGKGYGKGNSNNNSEENDDEEDDETQTFISDEVPESLKVLIDELIDNKKEISYQGYNNYYEEESLIVGVPIISDKEIIGTVLVMAPVEGISEIIDKAVRILEIGIIIGLLVAVILGAVYSLRFTKPLRKMNKTAHKMKNGDFNVKTGIKRDDEIGQLGDTIDVLAERLRITIDELYQEKGKLENIILSISDGLIAFDLDLNPISSNHSLANIMTRNLPYEDEAIINDFKKLNILDDIRNNEDDVKSFTRKWNNKILKITISNIFDSRKNTIGYVALLQDISQHERLEQMRKDFVANVSHEFRTPITVIRGSLEALSDGVIDDEKEILNYYKRMIQETRGLERLVKDLLELSRLQSGKISIKKEDFNLTDLIKDTLIGLRTIADKKNIVIHEEFDNKPFKINADYDRIKQLLVIFVENAVKYSPENTKVCVILRADEMIEILIKDEGYGIKEEEVPYIFDRFFKSDKARKIKGTGLGLAIAKHIIELHEGKVLVDSKVGKGTNIKVFLPFGK
jgi:two-component system sensor histidine kinase ResE